MKASLFRSLLLAALAMVPLSACSESGDWRDHQRILVERRPAVLNVAVRDDSVVRPEDMTRLQSFVDVFLNRGEAPVTLAVAKGEGEEADELAKQRVAKMAELLNAMGVPQNHLVVRTVPAGVGSVEGMARLAYDVYAVRVPQCGDWSDNSSFSFFSNDPSPSFGCAVTRNIGLMVDNPRDLVRPHELDGRDATRGATIIGKYRTGEDTVSKGAVSTSVSGVAGGK